LRLLRLGAERHRHRLGAERLRDAVRHLHLLGVQNLGLGAGRLGDPFPATVQKDCFQGVRPGEGYPCPDLMQKDCFQDEGCQLEPARQNPELLGQPVLLECRMRLTLELVLLLRPE
jgi:hypothetical protein